MLFFHNPWYYTNLYLRKRLGASTDKGGHNKLIVVRNRYWVTYTFFK